MAESVEPKPSDAAKDICKMTETGSVHRNELGLFSRMKTGIFWAFWHFPQTCQIGRFVESPIYTL
jgi:hypothetical protein